MSFLSGPECSTASNPLNQFTKHVQDDKSLQRDRLAGPGLPGPQEGFRSPSTLPNQDHMMKDFLLRNGSLPQDVPQPFGIEQLGRDLEGYHVNNFPRANSAWANEFNVSDHDLVREAQHASLAYVEDQKSRHHSAQLSPAEFRKFSSQAELPRDQMSSSQPWAMNAVRGSMGMGYGMTMGRLGPQLGPATMSHRTSEHVLEGKGKGRMVELDDKEWEKQFEAMQSMSEDGYKLKEADLDAQANQAIEEELDQLDRSVHSETNDIGDFESIWRGIDAELRSNGLDRTWHSEKGVHLNEDIPLSNIDAWDGFDSHFHDAFRDPQLGNYLFEQENPFTSTKNPFEEGLKIVREGGNLSLAALAFEAAVQEDPDHVQAWYQLGTAQAQNEKESPAIRALEQALRLDPANLPALMGLAISYTNEGYDSTAFKTLERWLATKYPQIISPDDLTPDTEYGFTDRHLLHEKVTGLFIRAAQLSPKGEQMDPDVQVGLGVLFYGAEEYEKAVDCFEAALASTEEGITNEPQQAHLLWNRLGATLANSGRSEDAIGAYEKALTLNPNFVRARYNLGVSCINIGVYEQAVQHLLGALSMHNVVEREGIEKVKEVMGGDKAGEEVERMVGMNQSTNLIETLRRVFGVMGRRDLAEKVERGMDVEAFRGEFDF